MIISGHNKKFENIDIHIKDSPIIRTKSYKYLSVKMYLNLNHSQHINNLAGIVNNQIRSITRIRHFLPKGIIMTLYKSLITAHLIMQVLSGDLLQHLYLMTFIFR